MSDNENIPSNNRQESNSPAVPFFVRYLEGQFEDLSQEETESISGGNCVNHTEVEESTESPGAVTRKFPSDQEDGQVVTLKFPSDQEDGQAVTLKFPSDNDDFPAP